MAWPDDLYSASYRGVAFEVEVSDAQFALRHQLHEFPGRDLGVAEQLGVAPSRFSVEGFIVGDDAQARKLELIGQCLKKDGGGTLVHPYYGALAVFCTNVSVRESNREGNLVRLSLEFVRVEGRTPVVERLPPAADAAEKADAVGAAAEAETAASLEVEAVPQFVRDGVAERLADLGAQLQRLDVFRGPAEEAAILGEEAARLIEQASALATSPLLVSNSIRQALQRVAASAGNARSALFAYEFFFKFDAPTFGGLTQLELTRDNNSRLIAAQVRQTAFAGAVQAAAEIDWPALDDALAARERVLEALDAELDETTPAQYEALALLRGALVAAVPPPERDLPRVQRLNLSRVTSALELAYELYDDASRAAELISRNRPEYAGRLPALATVEALSR
jgi:prophage DNA circulation protein